MAWIGLRSGESGVHAPAGLGRACPPGYEADALIARGSLMIEAAILPVRTALNILRFSVMDPWPARLSIVQEPDGTFRLLLRQGVRTAAAFVATSLGDKAETLRITYTWDAPGRIGTLSIYSPDRDRLWLAELPAPFPMPAANARRMMADLAACRLAPGVGFVALADHLAPVGPLPGIEPAAAIATPEGPRALKDLRPGDVVDTLDGRTAQVRWAGAVSLPAVGQLAPLTLRAPYHGAAEDLVLCRDQRLCLNGPEVEYLFGNEHVAAAARQLASRQSFRAAGSRAPLQSYAQVLLDRAVPINANGAWVESFDAGVLMECPAAWGHSVLKGLPPELRPRREAGTRVLQTYEALSLSNVSYG